MTKIVPAILVDNKDDYLKRISVVRQLTNRFQLDVIDGQYVDNRTIQLQEISRPTDLNMDVHLMVKDPKPYVEQAIVLHANNIIIQIECCEDISSYLERIKKSGLNAGAAINPETKLNVLKPLKDMLDHVLIMGYPAGFAGQKLNPIVYERLAEVRDMFPAAEVGLDGGVSPSNAKKVLQAGFDVVNINTLIFGNDDPLTAYSELLGYII